MHVRVLDDLRDVVDRPDRDLGLLEEGDVLGLRARGDERADDRVQLVGVLHALGVGAVARIVDQVGPADRAEQALGHLLRRGREARRSAPSLQR